MKIFLTPLLLFAALSEGGTVNAWEVRNCGSHSDPVVLNMRDVHPDPIKLPGYLVLSFDLFSKVDISSPFKVELLVGKEIFGFTLDLPCYDDFGSCTYTDVCAILRDSDNCPDFIADIGLPCKCPILAKRYRVSDLTLKLPDVNLPAFLTNGDYKIKAKGSSRGQDLFCYEFRLSIKS